MNEVLASLGRDCDWHRQWSDALLVVAGGPESDPAVAHWRLSWGAPAEAAAKGLGSLLVA